METKNLKKGDVVFFDQFGECTVERVEDEKVQFRTPAKNIQPINNSMVEKYGRKPGEEKPAEKPEPAAKTEEKPKKKRGKKSE